MVVLSVCDVVWYVGVLVGIVFNVFNYFEKVLFVMVVCV